MFETGEFERPKFDCSCCESRSPCADTTTSYNFDMVSYSLWWCIFVLASLHLAAESVTAVRQIGIVAVSLGVLVLILQPGITLTW